MILTLAVIAVLTAAGIQLAGQAKGAAMIAGAEKDRFRAEEYARSGINLGILLLVDDAQKTVADSVQEPWADSEKLAAAVEALGLDSRVLTVRITDELSKIQVNALVREFPGHEINPDQRGVWETLLENTLQNHGQEDTETDTDTLINAAKDWMDSRDNDAVTGLSGAESDYYGALDPPYTCPNRPFAHVSELSAVRGFSRDLFLSGQGEDRFLQQPEDIFTVYGMASRNTTAGKYRYPGKININTANETVLAALLPTGIGALAADLVAFRQEKDGQGNVFLNNLDKGWYKKVIELSEKEQVRMDRQIIYSSNFFKVDSTAVVNNARVSLSAFVKREKHKESGKWICRILQIERG